MSLPVFSKTTRSYFFPKMGILRPTEAVGGLCRPQIILQSSSGTLSCGSDPQILTSLGPKSTDITGPPVPYSSQSLQLSQALSLYFLFVEIAQWLCFSASDTRKWFVFLPNCGSKGLQFAKYPWTKGLNVLGC